MTTLFVCFILLLAFISYGFFSLNNKIDSNKAETVKRMDELSYKLKRNEEIMEDITNSMLGNEYDLLGLHRYYRDLERTYKQLDLLIKEKTLCDLGLYQSLCDQRSALRLKLDKTYKDIMNIRMENKK